MDKKKDISESLKKDRELLEDIQAGKPLPSLDPKPSKYIRDLDFAIDTDKLGTIPVAHAKYPSPDDWVGVSEKDKMEPSYSSQLYTKKGGKNPFRFLLYLIGFPFYLIGVIVIFLVRSFAWVCRRLRGEKRQKVKYDQYDKVGTIRGYQHRT